MPFGQQMLLQVTGTGDSGQGPIVLDQPVGSLPVVDDARWSAALTSHSWAALGVWLVLLVVLQAATWPVTRRIFARFPDQGWGFSRLLTMICAGYVVWLGASQEWTLFRAIWCWVAVVIVAGGSFLASRVLARSQPTASRHGSWLRNGSILLTEACFLAIFGLFLVYRLINHDSYHPVWGGEKPMEFAHINAILRSPHMPPIDPWYAGGTLNYYYYGAYLVAFLMKMTGIPSEIAFNLAQPTMLALLAGATCTLVMSLASRWSRDARVVRGAGATGVVLMVLSGNLVVASRLVSSLREAVPAQGDFVYWFWEPSRIVPFTIDEFPYFTGTYADLHAHGIALPITILLIGICWNLVLDARRFALATRRPGADKESTLMVGGQLVLLGLVFGTVYMTNAWDVPTYAAFLAVAFILITRAIGNLARRIGAIAICGGALGVITWLVTAPFRSHYVSFYSEIERVPVVSPPIAVYAHFGVFFLIVTLGLATIIQHLLPRPVKVFHPLVLGAGLSTVLLARLYAVDRSATWIGLTDGLIVLVPVLFLLFGLLVAMPGKLDAGLPGAIGRMAVVAAWIAVILALANDKTAFAMFLGLGSVAAIIWLMRVDAGTRFVAALIAGGMYVGGALELVYLFDGMTGEWFRMNTVFKFYMAVWAMLAIASAWLVGLFLQGVLDAAERQEPPEPPVDRQDAAGWSSGWSSLGGGVATFAIVASLAFPIYSTSARLDQQFADSGRTTTLNALDWMSYGTIQDPAGTVFDYAGDRAVIEWFNEHVQGTPVIVEASFGEYRCAGSRISIHTGLPDVIGWQYHDSQQRGPVDIQQRVSDVFDLYTSTDPELKREIIDKYDVEYVIVGDVERFYPQNRCGGPGLENSAGVAAFEPLVGNGLEVAFTAGETVVYRVV